MLLVTGLLYIQEVKNWKFYTLWIAGAYNIFWGLWSVLFPLHIFKLLNIAPPLYPQFWQCIGMIVGVYGLGYIIAAYNPNRHWPIVFVGLLGKIFGPIGFITSLLRADFPLAFGFTIITNDIIWWIPFIIILKDAYRASK